MYMVCQCLYSRAQQRPPLKLHRCKRLPHHLASNDLLYLPAVGALFLAAFVASCLRGALPPVLLRAVCFVRAILLTFFQRAHQRGFPPAGRRWRVDVIRWNSGVVPVAVPGVGKIPWSSHGPHCYNSCLVSYVSHLRTLALYTTTFTC